MAWLKEYKRRETILTVTAVIVSVVAADLIFPTSENDPWWREPLETLAVFFPLVIVLAIGVAVWDLYRESRSETPPDNDEASDVSM